MNIRNKIKNALKENALDPMYGKRPDMLVDKLEKLFNQEITQSNALYSRTKTPIPSITLSSSSPRLIKVRARMAV